MHVLITHGWSSSCWLRAKFLRVNNPIQIIANTLRRAGLSPLQVYALLTAALLISVLLLARIAFWLAFRAGSPTLDSAMLSQSFTLGLRFDLRLALCLIFPLLLVAALPFIGARIHAFARPRWWFAYAGLAWALLGLFIIFDFGHFAYLQLRLNASILNFLRDADTALGMMLQTYSVLPIVIGWLVFVALMCWLQMKLWRVCAALPALLARTWWKKGVIGFAATLVILFGIHGKFSQYPLRWSDAFTSGNPFAAAVALNPALNFFDTLMFKQAEFDEKAVREAYPFMAEYLGVDKPDAAKLDFRRVASPKPNALPGQPNVVLVLLESFSGYKTSVFNNPLKPTPNFEVLAQQGMLFTHFFTAHAGTARGVFATLTSLPDVAVSDTTSRNPLAVNQHLIVNALKGYDKMYFIGASTTWANIRGVLKNNIENLTIYEQDDYKAPVNDVWGISDKDLLLEANKIFRQKDKPFFAMIQTAGNHRPYTIPKQDTDFELKHFSDAELKASGFIADDEFNSFRYMDYSIGKFIAAAKKEKYFDNTVFVFLGDHGISGYAGAHMPRAWSDLRLTTGHTPMLIYAPKLIQPARHDIPAQQVDVMPTITGLLNFSYLNKSMGRDLLDPRFDDKRNSFIIYHSEGPEIGAVNKDTYLTMRADGSNAKLFDLRAENPLRDTIKDDKKLKYNQMLTKHLYETARYMLTHNNKEAHP
jgi:phosphoglycerol transferase MdoB-like AlkP superfamily enzyme